MKMRSTCKALSKLSAFQPLRVNTRLEQFRDHFEGIMRKRYEEPPEEIVRAVERAEDLRKG